MSIMCPKTTDTRPTVERVIDDTRAHTSVNDEVKSQ